MPVALPALELVAWLTFAVVFILAVTIKFWLSPLFHVINLAFGHVPFVGGAIKGGEDAVLSSLEAIIATSRAAMTTLLQGLRWSMGTLLSGVRDFADYVGDNWKVLVETAIPGAMGLLYAALHKQIASALGRLDNLENTVVSNLKAAQAFATAEAAHSLTVAERYTDTAAGDVRDFATGRIAAARSAIEGEIAAASDAVVHYVDASVSGLRHAEDAAVDAARAAAATALGAARRELDTAIAGVSGSVNALEAALEHELGGVSAGAAAALTAAAAELRGAIAGGVTDAENLASSALAAAEQTLEAELSHAATAAAADLAAAAATLQGAVGQVAAAEQATVAGITAAEHAATGELTDIGNLPTDAIKDLLDRIDLTKLLGFGAGLVLVRALVNAIATEAGLDSAACRAKHKQVCGVDPSEWTDLLAGAAFLTGTLSLAELVPIGRTAVSDLGGIIRELA